MLQDLDNVLSFIANSAFSQNHNPVRNLYEMCIQRHKMKYSYFRKVVEKLAKDGYLEKGKDPDGQTTYLLTFEGLAFSNKGGYKKQHKEFNFSKASLIWTIIGVIIALITLLTQC